jgi:hypothetical protein
MKKNIFQVRNEFHCPYLNWLPNCKLKNKDALSYFKGLSEDGGRADFSENLPRLDSTFKATLIIYHFSLVKATVKAPHVCKLH